METLIYGLNDDNDNNDDITWIDGKYQSFYDYLDSKEIF
jgi:hypothetical protein